MSERGLMGSYPFLLISQVILYHWINVQRSYFARYLSNLFIKYVIAILDKGITNIFIALSINTMFNFLQSSSKKNNSNVILVWCLQCNVLIQDIFFLGLDNVYPIHSHTSDLYEIVIYLSINKPQHYFRVDCDKQIYLVLKCNK